MIKTIKVKVAGGKKWKAVGADCNQKSVENGGIVKEGMTMFGYPEMIVMLWFVPVIVFIMIPLAMLGVWLVMQACQTVIRGRRKVKPLMEDLKPQPTNV